jgi:hypothetical protein
MPQIARIIIRMPNVLEGSVYKNTGAGGYKNTPDQD